MTTGPCNHCTKRVYDTDEDGRKVEILYCDLHFWNISLQFCSEECYNIHNESLHSSIEII